MQGISRRQFIIAGLGLVATGCSETHRLVTDRPRPSWPQVPPSPLPNTGAVLPSQLAHPHTAATLAMIPRSRWAQADPIPARLNKMGSIQRITIHHEGGTPVWFDDTASTSKRLESIRRSHLRRLHAGDIGYHYIIDRAGRVWEGRPLHYQGAHVRDNNEKNVGIMTLGNFDLQQPTDAQIGTLRQAVSTLMRQHRVPLTRVYTHQELKITSCPGKSLQTQMVQLRRNRWLG